ncbi:MAG: hypothetical protein EBR09_12735 [Proteobacteria bacterium]|jgi:hypothetical protein|nr:hypothetical protein [Pseudomonadota bacterium]
MKAINLSEFEIIKCGVEFVTTAVAHPGVEDLLPHMERNESYVYWMQPKCGTIEQQQACICVNGTYYALNNKLEKAIFRNVRLTRDFQNFERLVDGTRKLVIPQRLFQEKMRTSNRVCHHARPPARACAARKSTTDKSLFPQNISIMRKIKGRSEKSDKPKAAPTPGAPEVAAPAPTSDSPKEASSQSHRVVAKRVRKSKYNLHMDCVMHGQKRRKFNLESSDVLKEFSQALGAEDYPLIQTPKTFFRSLCDLFQQQFPSVLSEQSISSVLNSFDAGERATRGAPKSASA